MEQKDAWKVEHDKDYTLTRQQFNELIRAKVARNFSLYQLRQQDDQRETSNKGR